MKKTLRRNKGITLVTLVITIIILLILAGITINSLTGGGLFEKAQLAKQESEDVQKKENVTLEDYENKINEYISGTRENSNWKFLKTVVGTESIDISSITCDELYIEVNYNQDNIRYCFNIPYIALEKNSVQYRNGYGDNPNNMQNIVVEISRSLVKLKSVRRYISGSNEEKVSTSSISVYYK